MYGAILAFVQLPRNLPVTTDRLIISIFRKRFVIERCKFLEDGFLGICSLSVSPMVQKKLFMDSAMPALVEMCFLSIIIDEM